MLANTASISSCESAKGAEKPDDLQPRSVAVSTTRTLVARGQLSGVCVLRLEINEARDELRKEQRVRRETNAEQFAILNPSAATARDQLEATASGSNREIFAAGGHTLRA